jgi:hypothetical protein
MERNMDRVEPVGYRNGGNGGNNYGLVGWIEKYSAGLLTVVGSLLIGWGIGRSQGKPSVGLLIGLGIGLILMAIIIASDPRNRR